jgi:hypothetical protein
MHADRFDALARAVWVGATRRRLLRRLAVLPLLGTLVIRVADDEAVDAAHPVRRIQGRRARRRAQRRRRLRRQRRRCAHPCGACQRCRRGSCRPNADGSACGNDGACRGGSCICPGSRQLCGGKCVNTDSDPLNCGRCGTHCPIFGECQEGKCVCPKCPGSLYPFQCCAPDADGCSVCGDYDTDILGDPFTCQTNITRANCPPEQVCRGTDALCDTCCPPGTTCDTEFGRCLR